MFRFLLATTLGVALCATPAGAEDPKGMATGLVVVNTKAGVVVAGVKGGSLSNFMGFREGDRVLRYSFAGTEKKAALTVDDLNDLVSAKPGKYIVTLETKDGKINTIDGTLGLKEDGKTPFFIPNRPKK